MSSPWFSSLPSVERGWRASRQSTFLAAQAGSVAVRAAEQHVRKTRKATEAQRWMELHRASVGPHRIGLTDVEQPSQRSIAASSAPCSRSVGSPAWLSRGPTHTVGSWQQERHKCACAALPEPAQLTYIQVGDLAVTSRQDRIPVQCSSGPLRVLAGAFPALCRRTRRGSLTADPTGRGVRSGAPCAARLTFASGLKRRTPLLPARARYPVSTEKCRVLVLMMTNDLSQQKNAPACCNCHCTKGHGGQGNVLDHTARLQVAVSAQWAQLSRQTNTHAIAAFLPHFLSSWPPQGLISQKITSRKGGRFLVLVRGTFHSFFFSSFFPQVAFFRNIWGDMSGLLNRTPRLQRRDWEIAEDHNRRLRLCAATFFGCGVVSSGEPAAGPQRHRLQTYLRLRIS
jgi:hypothetical protein